jgi:hypothetical protein
MTQQQRTKDDSKLSANDNQQAAARKLRKKPPSGQRREPRGYPPEIKALTQKIKKIQGQELQARVEIGLELSRAKDLLGHGRFRPWLRREFRWSERTASSYMQLARHYEGKTAKFADLDLGTALALVANPALEKVRDEVFERADAGEKITREDVRTQIAEVKAAAPKRQAKAKMDSPSDEKKIATPPAASKSPAEEVAVAMLNLIQALEKNGLHCKPDDVAELLLDGGNRRFRPTISECAHFVNNVATGLAVLLPPEPEVVSELRSLAS